MFRKVAVSPLLYATDVLLTVAGFTNSNAISCASKNGGIAQRNSRPICKLAHQLNRGEDGGAELVSPGCSAWTKDGVIVACETPQSQGFRSLTKMSPIQDRSLLSLHHSSFINTSVCAAEIFAMDSSSLSRSISCSGTVNDFIASSPFLPCCLAAKKACRF